MSARRKGDEHASQESMGVQSLRSAKDKGTSSTVAGATAAAVAATAKLEKMINVTDHTPTKGGQLVQSKITADRKSQGGSIAFVSRTTAKNPPVKGAGGVGKTMETANTQSQVPEGEPSLKDILLAINACKQSLGEMSGQMQDIKEEIALVRHDLKKTEERVTEIEGRISLIEDELYPMKQRVKTQEEQINRLTEKMDEMENRLRRDNVRVVGLPEKSEGADPIGFFEKWLIETYGRETFSQQFSIERAHRVPFRPPQQGNPPRALLLKFLNHRDKINLLRRAREKGNIFYNGVRISIYPDFSPGLQKRRAEFLKIKRSLQGYDVTYSLLYPARLRVNALGGSQFFDSPKKALTWLEEKKDQLPLK